VFRPRIFGGTATFEFNKANTVLNWDYTKIYVQKFICLKIRRMYEEREHKLKTIQKLEGKN
jgi:hypothetical protein